mmetsp:Transcript_85374/g.174106  ORF Transcript_85374/g.174106 Transcript_85374/m.174106 type:complete len:155 (-) Transcript_85374:589-1053(-)
MLAEPWRKRTAFKRVSASTFSTSVVSITVAMGGVSAGDCCGGVPVFTLCPEYVLAVPLAILCTGRATTCEMGRRSEDDNSGELDWDGRVQRPLTRDRLRLLLSTLDVRDAPNESRGQTGVAEPTVDGRREDTTEEVLLGRILTSKGTAETRLPT